MTCLPMPRKRRTISVDEELLEAIDALCKKAGAKSFSVYVERLLAAHAVASAAIPPTYETPGETRGGNQYERRKKKNSTVEEPLSNAT